MFDHPYLLVIAPFITVYGFPREIIFEVLGVPFDVYSIPQVSLVFLAYICFSSYTCFNTVSDTLVIYALLRLFISGHIVTNLYAYQ